MSRPGLPTRGHHVFVPPFGDASTVAIEEEEGHHLAGVLRVRVGQALSLADDTGAVFQAEVAAVDRRRVEVAVVERFEVPAPAVRLSVVQGYPKGRKMEEVVQRLTEVGVDRIRPVVTSRSVKRPEGKADKLAERWAAIARAAAQQSRRARLPVIDPLGDWPAQDAVGVIMWEEAEEGIAAALAELGQPEEVTLAVGPEGGFSDEEVTASGLRPVAVGQTILRTETAGIVGATLVRHLLT